MLEQIIQSMHVDAELLKLLPDEDKQIIFHKIRQEQVRRYNEYDKTIQNSSINEKEYSPQICFRTGSDGKEWVWVMGEHSNDESIETILEKEAFKRAEQQALKEFHDFPTTATQPDPAPVAPKEDKEMKTMFVKTSPSNKKVDVADSSVVLRVHASKEAQRDMMIKRRSVEIMSSFHDIRSKFEHMAQQQKSQINQDWREREQRAKQAEKERQELARQARERTARLAFNVVNAVNILQRGVPVPKSGNNQGGTENVLPDSHPLKNNLSPVLKNKQEIIDWFRTTQVKNRSFISKKDDYHVAPWFHGLISQEDVERQLDSCEPNTFVIRLSDRICGYAISYRGQARVKHLLIGVEPNLDKSSFLFQILSWQETPSFPSLADLIEYYQTHSLLSTTDEYLQFPLPQQTTWPDYQDLLEIKNEDSLSTKL